MVVTKAPVDPRSREGRSVIPLFKVFMPPDVLRPLEDVLMSGWVGEGPRVEELERALAPELGTKNVLCLSSGTAALELALKLARVRPGDAVVSTALTCVATNTSIVNAGGRIVWADVDPRTGNVDPDDLRRKVNGGTKAIMVVHWGGDPCQLSAIHDVASKHGIPVIEDAGHAFGALYLGTPIGSHSDFVCFSFQAVKVLTTVDGGALTCRKNSDLDRGRLLRWYGLDRRERRRSGIDDDASDILEAGRKLHMNDVTAAIGLAQLPHVARNVARAQANARRYDAAFQDLASVRRLDRSRDGVSSCWLYTLRVDDVPSFRAHMDAAGIEVSKVHVRNDRYTVFREFAAHLPGLDELCAEHICIPVGHWLSDDDVGRIIDAVRAFDAARRWVRARGKGGVADEPVPIASGGDARAEALPRSAPGPSLVARASRAVVRRVRGAVASLQGA